MRKFKKVLSLCLAVFMICSMAACGNKDDEERTSNANTALAKENVYAYEKIDLGDLGDSANINTVDYIDGRIYMMLDIWVTQGAGVGARYGAMATAAVNSEIAVEDDFAVDGSFGVEPMISRNISRVYTFLPDGSDVKQFDLDTTIDENTHYNWLNRPMFGNGKVLAIGNRDYMDDSDPQNVIYKTIQELVCWGMDGQKLWTLDLTPMLEDEQHYKYISEMSMVEDGSIYVVCQSGSEEPTQIVIVDQEGNIKDQKEIKISQTNLNNTYVRSDGSLLLVSANDNWDKFFGSIYDLNTGVEGEQVEIPSTLIMNGYMKGDTTDFVITNSQGISTYNLGDAEVTPVMDFINSDFDGTWVNHVVMLDDQHMVAVYNDFIDYKLQVAYLTKKAPEEIPDKRVLVIGTNYLQSDVRQRVVNFNKTNTKYRIAIKDYSTYQTMDDYTAGYTQLNNDIIAGKMPDILVVDSNVKVDNYIAKGLIADVGKLIESDPELSQLEYMQNVFEAYKIGGTLYHVIPSFSVNTVMGKKSIVGDRTGWNMEEYLELAKDLPEGGTMMGQVVRDTFFRQIMQYCGTDFIDMATGKCSFNSQEFINMLEYAKTLPEEMEYDEDYWMNYESQYRQNRTFLMTTYIYSIKDMNYNINGFFGEDVSFIGFPNESKNGSVVTADNSYVLSSRSEDLEGAWEFVRYYLTEEYQNSENLDYRLPVLKSAFMENTKTATEKPYYIDGDGNKVEYEETFYMNGENIPIEPMTQRQVDEIVAFIESVNRTQYYDEDVINIITEEVAPFFAGQKTAADVAGIIQNRVGLYISANR